MSLLPPNRVLTTHKELRKLPVGAVVVNGTSDQDYYLFAKVEEDAFGGYWKWYDPDSGRPFHKQNAFHSLHPTYVSEKGFRDLNLPVFLLTKTGNREKLAERLRNFLQEVRIIP